MAIEMKLPKENNWTYADFENAYWVIENFYTKIGRDKTAECGFEVVVYPSKESRDNARNNYDMESYTPNANHVYYGAATGRYREASIYTWQYYGPVSQIFKDSIPSDYNEIMTACYEWLKKEWELNISSYRNV